MKLAVLGATGYVGSAVLDEALSRGHAVRALARKPGRLEARAGLEKVQGDALDPSALDTLIEGVDAVIQSLGVGGLGHGRLDDRISRATESLILRMGVKGPRRLVCISNVGTGGSHLSWIARRIVYPLFIPNLLPIMADKEAMEAALAGSSLDWSSIRFPDIADRPSRGRLRLSRDGRGIGISIPLRDAARLIVDAAESPTGLRGGFSASA